MGRASRRFASGRSAVRSRYGPLRMTFVLLNSSVNLHSFHIIEGLTMKNLVIFLLTAFSVLFAGWPDTVSTEVITPGVTHTQYTLPGPYTLDVLEVDLTNPLLTLESYRPNGLTKTTVQCAANDKPNHRVIGAVNGGFFSFETGWPIHNQVVNGKPVLGISTKKSAFAFTEERDVVIDRFSFSGTVVAKDGSTLAINKSNAVRGSGETVIFTAYKGTTTGTDASGAEAALFILPPSPPRTNDTVLAVVMEKGSGNMTIPAMDMSFPEEVVHRQHSSRVNSLPAIL